MTNPRAIPRGKKKVGRGGGGGSHERYKHFFSVERYVELNGVLNSYHFPRL